MIINIDVSHLLFLAGLSIRGSYQYVIFKIWRWINHPRPRISIALEIQCHRVYFQRHSRFHDIWLGSYSRLVTNRKKSGDELMIPAPEIVCPETFSAIQFEAFFKPGDFSSASLLLGVFLIFPLQPLSTRWNPTICLGICFVLFCFVLLPVSWVNIPAIIRLGDSRGVFMTPPPPQD